MFNKVFDRSRNDGERAGGCTTMRLISYRMLRDRKVIIREAVFADPISDVELAGEGASIIISNVDYLLCSR